MKKLVGTAVLVLLTSPAIADVTLSGIPAPRPGGSYVDYNATLPLSAVAYGDLETPLAVANHWDFSSLADGFGMKVGTTGWAWNSVTISVVNTITREAGIYVLSNLDHQVNFPPQDFFIFATALPFAANQISLVGRDPGVGVPLFDFRASLVSTIPEPSTYALLGAGLLAFVASRMRRRRAE